MYSRWSAELGQKIIGLKSENLKYLQVDYHVISTFDRKPPRYDAEQVDALREIAAAIKIKADPHGTLSARRTIWPVASSRR